VFCGWQVYCNLKHARLCLASFRSLIKLSPPPPPLKRRHQDAGYWLSVGLTTSDARDGEEGGGWRVATASRHLSAG